MRNFIIGQSFFTQHPKFVSVHRSMMTPVGADGQVMIDDMVPLHCHSNTSHNTSHNSTHNTHNNSHMSSLSSSFDAVRSESFGQGDMESASLAIALAQQGFSHRSVGGPGVFPV